MSLILYAQCKLRQMDIFVNVAIRIQFLSRESLLPRKLFWKEKHELFAKIQREGVEMKVVA